MFPAATFGCLFKFFLTSLLTLCSFPFLLDLNPCGRTLTFILHSHDKTLFFRDKSLEKTLHFALDQFESLVFSCEKTPFDDV